jgi:hypothetical protein
MRAVGSERENTDMSFPRVACGTLSSIRRCPHAENTQQGGIAMTAFVSQPSIVVTYAVMAFVGAIVLGVP